MPIGFKAGVCPLTPRQRRRRLSAYRLALGLALEEAVSGIIRPAEMRMAQLIGEMTVQV